MTAAQDKLISRAYKDGFLTLQNDRQSKSSLAVYNSWYKICRRDDRVFMVVTPRGKGKSHIKIDNITLRTRYGDPWNHREVMRELAPLSAKKSKVMGGREIISATVDRTLLPQAVAILKEAAKSSRSQPLVHGKP
jgi:hypothetical protein